MRVLGVAGYSDSGKTTVIERLVPVLRERGRVATVKSIHHDVEMDDPGKDTHRHRTAGAHTVVGVTPSLTFRVDDGGKGTDPDAETAALDRVLGDLADADYVLVEGFKQAAIPTLLVGDVPEDEVGGEVMGRVTVDDLDVERVVALVEDLPDYVGPAEQESD
ncbi:molybdopterin-guanine dinucleotide biosynthesis protein B [Halobacteriaceae archaeon GCM10025711]